MQVHGFIRWLPANDHSLIDGLERLLYGILSSCLSGAVRGIRHRAQSGHPELEEADVEFSTNNRQADIQFRKTGGQIVLLLWA